MKNKLKSILLIDDNEATNFFHQIIIDELDCTEQCIIKENGKEALNFLTQKENGEYPRPELILLDINMPILNGWEFIDAYNKLDIDQKGKIVVVMLTTSLNIDDKKKAEGTRDISSFMHKPLDAEGFLSLLKTHFPEKF